MLGFPSSSERVVLSWHGRRGRYSDAAPVASSHRSVVDGQCAITSLSSLCLHSLESSLGKGLATFSLHELPLGLVENIYEFVFSKGSRMAQMELSRAASSILSEHVNSIDFGSSGGAKFLGDSALLELANGCDSGLVHLDLSNCHFVTNAGIIGALLKCPAIKSLSLSGCYRITDEVTKVCERTEVPV